jgi:hypothetical protein
MLDHPHIMIQDRFTRPVSNADRESYEDSRPQCCDCRRSSGGNLAFVHVRLPTMDAYLCAEHFDARKAKDNVTRGISLALSSGFSAGNYANAYTSTDLDTAWERFELSEEAKAEEDNEDYPEAIDPLTKASFRAAFVIGFFGSYEPDEIQDSEQKDEYDAAMVAWGERMKHLGIAVDLDMCDTCDGFVSSDHAEHTGHNTIVFNASDMMP